jgi:hypothetical protein
MVIRSPCGNPARATSGLHSQHRPKHFSAISADTSLEQDQQEPAGMYA